MRTNLRDSEQAGGIQDARATFALLEQFGLVEREIPQKTPLPLEGGGAMEFAGEYITDHNGGLCRSIPKIWKQKRERNNFFPFFMLMAQAKQLKNIKLDDIEKRV